LEPSGEAGVKIIQALVGQGDLLTNVNVENEGQISNLPRGAVVETNAHFSADCLRPVDSGSLPAGLAPLLNLHCANQELIVEAALTGDRDWPSRPPERPDQPPSHRQCLGALQPHAPGQPWLSTFDEFPEWQVPL
jgi:hypothetical protein